MKLMKDQKEFKDREFREQAKRLKDSLDLRKTLELRVTDLERQITDDHSFY